MDDEKSSPRFPTEASGESTDLEPKDKPEKKEKQVNPKLLLALFVAINLFNWIDRGHVRPVWNYCCVANTCMIPSTGIIAGAATSIQVPVTRDGI